MREYQKTYHRRYREENKESIAYQKWVGFLKKRYKISVEEFDRMLAAQENLCAICKSSFDDVKLVIDHDHQTGKVRGLLCDSCNVGIGRLKDDPKIVQKALEYLRRIP